jgi:O-antigen/teichoic acid export membrane protein
LNFLAFAAATVWVWLRLEGICLAPRLRWHHALFRRTFGYGLKAYAVTFFGFLVLRVDALLVQDWRGAFEAGQYGVAVQLGDLMLTVSTTVAMITFPTAAERGAAAWPLIRRLTHATGAALAVACVIAYMLAPWGIQLLFGKPFVPAASAFRILLPGIWCLSIETLLVQYLNGLGMPIVILWCWLGALAVNIIANAFLIPTMGIDGAAWASTFAYAFMAFLVAALVVSDRRSRANKGA